MRGDIISSTNRSDARDFHVSDYYITPKDEINKFIEAITNIDFNIFSGRVLDPCAGGDTNNDMSYPSVIKNMFPHLKIDTLDIRTDSQAEYIGDYLKLKYKDKYQTIITNPPFMVSLDIIKKAIDDVQDNGFVIMLQRLNFMGSKSRKQFWEENIPKYIFVHHKRMGFTNDGKTDSIEYAHYVWQKGYRGKYSQLYII